MVDTDEMELEERLLELELRQDIEYEESITRGGKACVNCGWYRKRFCTNPKQTIRQTPRYYFCERWRENTDGNNAGQQVHF